MNPFIKKFKTKNGNYVYDVNSHNLLRVNPIVYDIIDDCNETGPEEIIEKFKHLHEPSAIRENYELIKRMQKEKDYFSDRRPGISSEIDSIEDVQTALGSSLRQIVLELTEQCNQRCRYCSFSGKYAHSRTHGNTDMTFETAKKALDFFIERSRPIPGVESIAVTYYGGEPLLRFDLLKETVDYVLNTYKDKKVSFSFTTNGTLLDRTEIIDFLIKNDFQILVSIDGPKHMHDRNRVFKNKKPTFDVILNNLSRIREANPQYFLKKISISAVLTPPFDMEAVSDFFFKNDLFEGKQELISATLVDPVDTTFFSDYGLEEEMKKAADEFDIMLKRYKEAVINGTYEQLTLEKQLFLKRFYNIASRTIYPLPNRVPSLGQCFPGKRKLFVDTVGNFYMCEKVRGNLKIGDVNNGFNYETIYRFYREYDRFFSLCGDCWALRLCNKCFNTIRKGEQLDAERRDAFCRNTRENIKHDLITFCEIIDENPQAFKVYENVVVS
jgi:uncharacterized protein